MNGIFIYLCHRRWCCYFAKRFPCCWFALSYAGSWARAGATEYQPRHLATRFLVRVNDAVWYKNQYASGGALPAFPVTISTFFGTGTAIFSIVDLLSLISAALIFTLFFYYPLRMIVSPHYMRIFWRRDVAPYLAKENACLRFSGLPLWRRY